MKVPRLIPKKIRIESTDGEGGDCEACGPYQNKTVAVFIDDKCVETEHYDTHLGGWEEENEILVRVLNKYTDIKVEFIYG